MAIFFFILLFLRLSNHISNQIGSLIEDKVILEYESKKDSLEIRNIIILGNTRLKLLSHREDLHKVDR